MNKDYNTKFTLAAGVILGAAITAGTLSLFSGKNENAINAPAKEEPLYWVAPMDPNYTRDKPGKSPMGMDLIPVFADKSEGIDAGPGTISISADVINKLGVRSARVERKTLHTEIKTVGYVKYDEDQLVHVHPRVEGWIEKLYVKAQGNPVKKGQPLYKIYSPALVIAQEELVLALGRNNPPLIRGAEERLKSLQFPSLAIKKLKADRKVQQNVTFYAPQSGVLDNLNIRQGYFVKPGTRLMSIGVLDQVWVEAEIFEDQVAAVKTGLPVTMTLGFLPGKTWLGKVDYVYPSLDMKTRTLKVRLRFDNENAELKPNMFAQVSIHAQSQKDTLLIPKEAVIRTGSLDRAVLALGDGRFKSVKVTLGRNSEEFIEILSGLTEGEQVVTSAQFLLDSESSKTSDFKRMHHEEEATSVNTTVWTQGVINSVMTDHRMINVSHQAIPELDWAAMTMNFTLAENIRIGQLPLNTKIKLALEKNASGQYQISATENLIADSTDTAMPMNMSGSTHLTSHEK